MSTSKTQHYQLHSWLPQDEFHLTEINENFSLLDAALKAEAQAAAAGQAALNTAVGQRVRMVTGKYNGNNIDATPRQITLGFRPRAVVIINTYRNVSDTDMSFLAVESNPDSNVVALTDAGFAVANKTSRLNYSGTIYHYAAFY